MTFEIKPPQTSTLMLYYPYFANDLGFLLNFGIYLGERTFLFVFHFFFLVSIVLNSLFRLFYVTCELNSFLH